MQSTRHIADVDEASNGREPSSATASILPDATLRDAVTFAANAAATHDEAGTFPAPVFDFIAERGLLAAPLTRQHGGAGLVGTSAHGPALLHLLKEMGRGDLSVGRVYEGHINAFVLIHAFGTQQQIERWSSDARDARRTFGVWNTEAADGVHITPLPDGRYRLDGSKTFASGAGYVTRPIVPGALPDGGWQMCVVPMERVAVTIDPSWWRPLGMRASASYKVDFSGVVIDADDLLGDPGDYHRQPWLGGGVVRYSAVQLGGAEALFDATRTFLRSLGRGDDPYQRARMGDATVLIERGHQWLQATGRRVDLGPDAASESNIPQMLAYADMMRIEVERICTDMIQIATRSAGARALLQPHPIERIVRDLTLFLRQPAPDAALANVGRYALETDAPAIDLWTR